MYGGAMVTGSNSNPQLQGNNFARNGVIYVNFNTRESIFASPYSAELQKDAESQNFSILDVEKALEWIHDNIRGKMDRVLAVHLLALATNALVSTSQLLAAIPIISFLVATRLAVSRSIIISGTIRRLGSRVRPK
jgi:hypothetical protein